MFKLTTCARLSKPVLADPSGFSRTLEPGQTATASAVMSSLPVARSSRSTLLTGNQLKQLLRATRWLFPADPSTNHIIARKAQSEGTTVWFCKGGIFIEWKSTGGLLWIHGKPGSGKSVLCSSIIQDIMVVCETGSAIMAYFYFDSRDLNKKNCRDLLRSLISQLSTRSSPCCDILCRVHKAHEDGAQQPSDDTLKECLKEMLKLPGQGAVFIILDGLDECPESPGIPSPRNEVLLLVKELIDLHLQKLHICATSRPEVDIRAVLEPLAFRSVSLDNEIGQKKDIADYVQRVVNASPSTAMGTWRAEDKKLVIETLTERADGMFRWVFCQLDALQHCFPPNLPRFLNEFPETLGETYERILRGINQAQRDDAHRLFQCLTVAARPLRVEEIAELLAFDCQAWRSGGFPKLENWRWDDHEEAVLSTCSSLIAIVRSGDSRVVQFSHFSVKGYLTSPRLARYHEDVSRFHIDLDSAHTIMAQACLGTLLRLDEHVANSAKEFPLVEYAAQHWVGHAQFENVSSRLQDGMDDLFDTSKPHFAAWLQVHDIDEPWPLFSYQFQSSSDGDGSPLYYAALCGFYQLAERLIVKNPEEVNEEYPRGWIAAPLPAALYKRHFRVADLLYRHGARVEARGSDEKTPLHVASQRGDVDIMRWLFDHGADVNAWDEERTTTPLHLAALGMRLEVVQVLLDHNADPNFRGSEGTPLHWAIPNDVPCIEGMVSNVDVNVVRLLLKHGADVTIPDYRHSAALHRASSGGWLEVVRLLLSYGAKIDEKDGEGKTPFQIASSMGHLEIMKYLSENGAVVGVQDNKETTPFHEASMGGHVDVMRWLLDHGADANARQGDRCTPLHLAASTNLEAVQVLLEHNANVNSQDDKGKTPLHEASAFAQFSEQKERIVDIVQQLLDHGADPNIRDHSLSTPLHQASAEGLLEVARLLIARGAKVDEKDEKGKSPFQVAASEGHRELTKFLLEHTAVP